ncbi:MAG: hypothetical protein K9I34_05140 [Bacteroidales bacterium]|nr:hypothetical protein [Bacteroidales bacterium]
MRTNIIFILVGFSMLSCIHDDQLVELKGTVTDSYQLTELENVEVKLYVNEMVNGSWSTNFVYKESAFTDSKGKFSLSIPFVYTTAYRLDIQKDEFFPESYEILEGDFENNAFSGEFILHPQATLHMHFKNGFPYNNQDLISYRLAGWEALYDDCCPAGFRGFVGEDVDETVTCKVIGGANYTIEYIISRNNNQNVGTKEVNCPPFETTNCEIIY